MPDWNYLLIQQPSGSWHLYLYGDCFGYIQRTLEFRKYIDALRALRILQLHISPNDRVKEAV